ncbi:MAG: DUF1643 domain-containing protein [Nanoarchaeota archaeon]|nr:DUF1643 domain-containing protein [Nanoarchaeota archaeon]
MIKKSHIDENGVTSEAIYSDCEKYRYTLSRTWDNKLDGILFIGLNPSTATELKNDPTVTRMINYAKAWNFGSITVCNAFAFRSTFPKDLKKTEEPVGEENDKYIMNEAQKSKMIMAAWGNHAQYLGRSKQILSSLGTVHHLGITKQGEPRHPLYLKSNLKPILMN